MTLLEFKTASIGNFDFETAEGGAERRFIYYWLLQLSTIL